MITNNTIYPQKINGFYRIVKDLVLYGLLFIYFATPWLRWSRGENYPNQAIIIDLPNRRGYFFNIEIWPDEVYYITGALILAALGLFIFTAIFGRIWCGYTCPHTVFVEIFIKIESFFQGDRNERMRLDAAPFTIEKFVKKTLTHFCWLLVGFAFAVGWVSYFYDAPSLWRDLFQSNLSDKALPWLWGLTFSTYILGGFARQRVCIYMCPYGRFQSAMLDNDSSVVTYHSWRGEPRGKNAGSGDCIDCYKCVVVCPMGIDIRDGLQMACIGCGLCIDACNSVMAKISKPLGLIAYDSINSTEAKKNGLKAKSNVFRAKTMVFGLVFIAVASFMLNNLLNKPELVINSSHGRGALFTLMSSGEIRNSYEVKIANRTMDVKRLLLKIANLQQAKLKIQNMMIDYADDLQLILEPGAEWQSTLFIQAPILDQKTNQQKIIFDLTDINKNKNYSTAAIFVFK
jgi:cytochrome c oxidase accessory protein FixG